MPTSPAISVLKQNVTVDSLLALIKIHAPQEDWRLLMGASCIRYKEGSCPICAALTAAGGNPREYRLAATAAVTETVERSLAIDELDAIETVMNSADNLNNGAGLFDATVRAQLIQMLNPATPNN